MLNEFSDGNQWKFLSPFGKFTIITLISFMVIGIPANIFLLVVTEMVFTIFFFLEISFRNFEHFCPAQFLPQKSELKILTKNIISLFYGPIFSKILKIVIQMNFFVT